MVVKLEEHKEEVLKLFSEGKSIEAIMKKIGYSQPQLMKLHISVWRLSDPRFPPWKQMSEIHEILNIQRTPEEKLRLIREKLSEVYTVG